MSTQPVAAAAAAVTAAPLVAAAVTQLIATAATTAAIVTVAQLKAATTVAAAVTVATTAASVERTAVIAASPRHCKQAANWMLGSCCCPEVGTATPSQTHRQQQYQHPATGVSRYSFARQCNPRDAELRDTYHRLH